MLYIIFMSRACLKGASMPTFITLIPNKKGAKELKYFRPINLIGSVYKIFSKVLREAKRTDGKTDGITTNDLY